MSETKLDAKQVIANSEGWTPEQALVLYTVVEALRNQFKRGNSPKQKIKSTQRETELHEALTRANTVLCLCNEVASRDGARTNWRSLQGQIKHALDEQHKLFYGPEQVKERKHHDVDLSTQPGRFNA